MVDIEKEVLQKLMYNPSMNYNSLWDKEKYPSSKFSYYLKQLVQKELIEKNEEGLYQLTQAGNQRIAEMSNKNFKKQTIPLTVAFVLCIDSENRILLQKRKKQPYLGIYNIPGGKVDFCETTYDAGIRELKEESNLDVHSMKLKLIDEVHTFYDSGEKFAHIMAYTYVCRDFDGKLVEENKEGEMKWFTLKEIRKLNHIFPNLIEMIPKLTESEEVIIQETKRIKNQEGDFLSYEINEKF